MLHDNSSKHKNKNIVEYILYWTLHFIILHEYEYEMLKRTFPFVGGSWIYMLLIFNAYYLGIFPSNLADNTRTNYTQILQEHNKHVQQIESIFLCDVYKQTHLMPPERITSSLLQRLLGIIALYRNGEVQGTC